MVKEKAETRELMDGWTGVGWLNALHLSHTCHSQLISSC